MSEKVGTSYRNKLNKFGKGRNKWGKYEQVWESRTKFGENIGKR